MSSGIHDLFNWPIKTVKFGNRFKVTLYDTGKYDSRGQTGLAYRVWERKGNKLKVVKQSQGITDVVHGSPMHADDSNQTMRSAISLICHEAGGAYGEHKAEDWSHEDLDNEASMRWADY